MPGRLLAAGAAFVALIALGGCAAGLHMHPDIEGPSALLAAADRQSAEAVTDTAVAALPRTPLQAPRPPYRIGPLDELTLVVTGRPDLGSQVPQPGGDRRISPVAADGAITLALLGRVQVAGQTPAEARAAVQAQYAKLVTSPQVEIEMVVFRSQGVFIEGEVERPGRLFLSEEVLTLGEALAAAGGLTASADGRHAVLERAGRLYPLDLQRTRQGPGDLDRILLRAEDRIFIPTIQDRIVYVFGEVGKQGSVPVPARGLTILEALAQSQGPSVETAESRRLYLVRPVGRDSTVCRLDLADLVQGQDVPMLAGDRLYVAPTRIATWGRALRFTLPWVYLASTAFLIGREIAKK
jgi:polysaccharide biosynthesis/export protein